MTDESDPDRPARAAEPVRVARFESLGAATDGGAPVAGFDDLDAAAGGRPAARVISFDSVADRRARRSGRPAVEPIEPVELDRSGSASPPARGRGQASDTGRARGARGSAPRVSADGPEPDSAELDSGGDGVAPGGPLPRGRRRRARVGRLGPDAPDPELPEPEADPAAIAREICLRLLTDRARTRQELASALARKGVPAEAAAEVLDRFGEVGLIDDAAFAGQWVRSRHVHRGLGRRAIAVELRRKGVADEVAGEALAEVDAESEDLRARELVDRTLRSLAVGRPDQRATVARRLVGMLARKGYGAGTAYRVVRAALAEHGAQAGELHVDVPDE